MQQVVTCPGCGTQNVGNQFCTVCGTRLPVPTVQEVSEPEPATAPAAVEPTAREVVPVRKYGALRAVAMVYRIIGWVVMVGGTLFSIALAVIAVQGGGGFSEFMPWAAGLGTAGIAIGGVVGSILAGLFMVAFADLCYLLIDIESNTRLKE
jgi:hypothetical protein